MRKDYDENNRYILEDKSFVDTKTNECLNFGIKDLSRVAVQLNCMERYLNNADQKIAELQKQLEENEKEILRLHESLFQCDADRKFEQEKKNLAFKKLTEISQQLKREQNKKAVEELKLALDNFRNRPTYFDVARQELCLSEQDKQFIDFINNRIKELGGEDV